MGEQEQHVHEIGWVMIPPTILAATDLSMGEKVVCGRVIGLIGKQGYCFATNEWLGKQLGYSDRTVEDYVRKLVSKGYLHRNYGPNGKRDRRLWPIPEMTGKGIPIPEIAGSHPRNSRDPSLLGQGSSMKSSVEVSSTQVVKPSSGSRPRPKKESINRMKREDLNRLTEHYATVRGARPQGNAWKPIQQGFRQMVAVEGYTVEQVIGCMDRIVKLGWTWTINTVRTWIADFAAGTMPTEGIEAHHEPSQLRPGTSRGKEYYLGTGGGGQDPPARSVVRNEAASAIWDEAMAEARDELSYSEYETWFNGVIPIGVENGHLRIAVSDPFTKGGIERRYREMIEELVTEVRGEPTELVIEVVG